MPTYEIELSRTATKALKKLPKQVSARIFEQIRKLGSNPRPNGVKKLTGHSLYRIRVGDYRVIYGVHDGKLTVLVVDVGHRKEIYK